MISYAWMAKKKGSRGQYDREVGTYRFLNENEHDTSLTARSGSVPGETNTRGGGSLSVCKATAPQLTSTVRACNAHTPELESSTVTTTAAVFVFVFLFFIVTFTFQLNS